MRCERHTVERRNEQSETVRGDEVMQASSLGFRERGWDIHRRYGLRAGKVGCYQDAAVPDEVRRRLRGLPREVELMLPLYEDPCFTFRFDDDRIIPRFHVEGV